MNQFLQYFGLLCLIIIIGYVILRLIFGKKWQYKIAWVIFVGPGLMGASKKLADELPNKVKKETLAEVATYAFMRLTRIGLVGMVIAIVPITLLWIQNNKITEQNYLIESQRRSSLVLLMNNVLTDLSAEIEKQREGLDSIALAKKDSIGYELSQPLIGRIASLSQGLLPYRFLVDGKLTEKEYSIERGQLLLALVKSGLNHSSLWHIFNSSIFSSAYLRNANLVEANLVEVNLSEADLSEANLIGADLRGAYLNEAIFNEARLHGANLNGASLIGADLIGASLIGADLIGASLIGADLIGANLNKTDLNDVDLRWADLREVDLHWVDLSDASNLFKAKRLTPTIRQQLEKEKPCLFTQEGCE